MHRPLHARLCNMLSTAHQQPLLHFPATDAVDSATISGCVPTSVTVLWLRYAGRSKSRKRTGHTSEPACPEMRGDVLHLSQKDHPAYSERHVSERWGGSAITNQPAHTEQVFFVGLPQRVTLATYPLFTSVILDRRNYGAAYVQCYRVTDAVRVH